MLSRNYSFTLTVQSDCVNTAITDKTIINMSNIVSLAAFTQDVSFLDSIATSHPNPTYCGARTYSLSPSLTFLTISGSSIMSLSTNNVTDRGVYNVAMTVSLTSYPGVASLTKNLVVTITCEVQTLTFSTAPPASTTLQVGIDTQPSNFSFATTQTPACGNTVTFTLSPTLPFLSLPSPTLSGGNVLISGANNSNHNTYAEVLTATVDGQTTTANFIIIIIDPCSTAAFETTPAGLVNITINAPSVVTSTQTIVIKTDVEAAYSAIVCPFTVTTMTPSVAFISLSANTIYVNAALISLPGDLGTHTVTITIVSANFPGTVASKTYNFNFEVICAVTSLSIVSQASNTTLTLNYASFNTAAFMVV